MSKTTGKNKKGNNHPSGRLIKREDSILVIIDVQERLVPVIANHEKIIASIVKLVRFAKIVGLPVIIVEQEKLGPTVREIKKELPDCVPVTKMTFSAARQSEFVKKLDGLSGCNIILTGVETHVCVMQTALELLPDFNIHVVSDAVSSRSPEDSNIALQRLNQSGAVISSTEMVIYELLEKAGTEEFRKVHEIVK